MSGWEPSNHAVPIPKGPIAGTFGQPLTSPLASTSSRPPQLSPVVRPAGPIVTRPPVPTHHFLPPPSVPNAARNRIPSKSSRPVIAPNPADVGKSSLPAARVHHIVKADKDIEKVGKEAVFLISKVTERFIARLADASFAVAYAEGRKTIGYKDMARAVERAEEFFFLSEVIPVPIRVKEALDKRRQMNDEDPGLDLTMPDEENLVDPIVDEFQAQPDESKLEEEDSEMAPNGAQLPLPTAASNSSQFVVQEPPPAAMEVEEDQEMQTEPLAPPA